MEDTRKKKRARDDDSDLDSPESKRVNLESPERVNSELDTSGSSQIPADLLDILDDSDPASQDLDSVIKSFEEEILYPPTAVADLLSESGESLPDLGYLLEASDDELGLPPTISPSYDQTNSDPIEFNPIAPVIPIELEGMVRFEDDMPSYDSFGFGILGEAQDNGDMNSEFVTLGGLFDYPDESDFSEFLWQPESLPAL